MNTAPLVVENFGFNDNRFNLLAFPERNQRATSLSRSSEWSRSWERSAQSFRSGQGVEPSSRFYFRPQQVAGGPSYPLFDFSETLRRFYLSERFGLSAKLCQRLVELLALQPGWDGDSATPPRPEVLANSVGLLILMNAALPKFREPFLAPTINGFAQMEWHNGRRTLEFEVTSNGWSIVGAETISSGEKVYHDADAARVEVEKLIVAYRWFEGTDLLWPII